MTRVLAQLDDGMRKRLDELLGDGDEGCALLRLRGEPGRIGLESLLGEVEKLKVIRSLALPTASRAARGWGRGRLRRAR
jgi:hypothetical protein